MTIAWKHGLVFNKNKCRIKKKNIILWNDLQGQRNAPKPWPCEGHPSYKCTNQHQGVTTLLGYNHCMAPFIPNLLQHTAPLRDMLKKINTFQWTTLHQTAFKQIKKHILLYIGHFCLLWSKQRNNNSSGCFTTRCRCSSDSRKQSEKGRSQTQNSTMQNTEREMLAVLNACEKIPYVHVWQIFHCLVWPLASWDDTSVESHGSTALQRMLLCVQDYDLLIRYNQVRSAYPQLYGQKTRFSFQHFIKRY